MNYYLKNRQNTTVTNAFYFFRIINKQNFISQSYLQPCHSWVEPTMLMRIHCLGRQETA